MMRRAIAGNDLVALMKIPGVGRKGAERIVLELRDKIGALPEAGALSATTTTATGRDQVTEALVGLGWSAKSAADAVAARPDAPTEVAALLRAALRELGR